MDVRTLPQILHRCAEIYGKPDALRYKRHGEYVDISARELQREVESLAYGLLALGMQPGDRVALLSENRPGWALADLAILSGGGLTVPIYPSLTADHVEYILRNCGARICIVSTREQLEKVLSVRAGSELDRVITLDPVRHEDPVALSMKELLSAGERQRADSPGLLRERLAGIDPHGVATILYTSGTTGRPKGVMLSHHNILSNIQETLEVIEITPSDVCLSFLPLSHILERMAGFYAMLYAGGTIVYAESMESVARNMAEVRPTLIIGVPRLYEKMYARVLEAAQEGSLLKRGIFFWAKRVGEKVVERRLAGRPVGKTLAARYALARRLVFSKLHVRTGERLKFFFSGGAPLSPAIAKFFWAADLPIFEGYGLTETSPVIACNTPRAVKLGSVGKPLRNVQVRIAEDGEILCRGPNVMQGYYQMPEETAATIVGGWLKTGDIGYLDAEGFLVITDRKKDLIKTSGGKYIAPQPIENRLKLNKFVAQAVIVGNRRKYASALIVPNFENLRKHAEESGLAFSDLTELLERREVHKLYQRIVDEVNRDLDSFETIKRFTLLPQEFTIESGELTPTLKIKRNVVEKRYGQRIDAMYGEEVQV